MSSIEATSKEALPSTTSPTIAGQAWNGIKKILTGNFETTSTTNSVATDKLSKNNSTATDSSASPPHKATTNPGWFSSAIGWDKLEPEERKSITKVFKVALLATTILLGLAVTAAAILALLASPAAPLGVLLLLLAIPTAIVAVGGGIAWGASILSDKKPDAEEKPTTGKGADVTAQLDVGASTPTAEKTEETEERKNPLEKEERAANPNSPIEKNEDEFKTSEQKSNEEPSSKQAEEQPSIKMLQEKTEVANKAIEDAKKAAEDPTFAANNNFVELKNKLTAAITAVQKVQGCEGKILIASNTESKVHNEDIKKEIDTLKKTTLELKSQKLAIETEKKDLDNYKKNLTKKLKELEDLQSRKSKPTEVGVGIVTKKEAKQIEEDFTKLTEQIKTKNRAIDELKTKYETVTESIEKIKNKKKETELKQIDSNKILTQKIESLLTNCANQQSELENIETEIKDAEKKETELKILVNKKKFSDPPTPQEIQQALQAVNNYAICIAEMGGLKQKWEAAKEQQRDNAGILFQIVTAKPNLLTSNLGCNKVGKEEVDELPESESLLPPPPDQQKHANKLLDDARSICSKTLTIDHMDVEGSLNQAMKQYDLILKKAESLKPAEDESHE